MDRKQELTDLFKGMDANVLTIVGPMIDELVFVEAKLEELRTKPFIKYHPDDPSIQKATPTAKLYKDLLAQQKDIIRILCGQLHKTGGEEVESPLRDFLKSRGAL